MISVCRTTCVVAGLLAALAACGGKVSGTGDSQPSPRGSPTSAPLPPPSTGTVSPQPASVDASRTAAEIADGYCAGFDGCCSGAGLPPIDIARCREVTIGTLEPYLTTLLQGRSDPALSSTIDGCVAAIQTRTKACGKRDRNYGAQAQAFFGPSSIQAACGPLLGAPGEPAGETCASPTLVCPSGRACAVDECVLDGSDGEPCIDAPCLDSFECTGAATCAPRLQREVGSACLTTADCRLGLVCSVGECRPHREHTDLTPGKFSPYRVGADTCRAYTYL